MVSSRAMWRGPAAVVLLALAISGVAFASCAGKGGPGDPCSSTSDCLQLADTALGANIVCALGRCHFQCATPSFPQAYCGDGAVCAEAQGTAFCTLPDEASCMAGAACPSPLTCGSDGLCRTPCTAQAQCVAGQECSGGACYSDDAGSDAGVPPDGTAPDSGSESGPDSGPGPEAGSDAGKPKAEDGGAASDGAAPRG